MKKIKNILVASILTVSAFTGTIMTSCNPDPCNDIVCNNGGTCTDGSCSCPAGYEGSTCDTLSRTKFVGNYSCTDNCTTGSGTYTATIAASSTDDTKTIVMNIGNINSAYSAYAVCDQKTFTIPSQTVSGTTTTVISGNGNYSNGVISGSYQLTVAGTVIDNCTFAWTKQ